MLGFEKVFRIICGRKSSALIAFSSSITVVLFVIFTSIIHFSWNRVITNLFIAVVIIERVYETFFINKDWIQKPQEKDWLLSMVVYTYIGAIIACVVENNIKVPPLNYINVVAVLLYLSSLAVRFWSIQSLGRSWNISSTNV